MDKKIEDRLHKLYEKDSGNYFFEVSDCVYSSRYVDWLEAYFAKIEKENKELKRDGIVCPRCGKVFHDIDMKQHPEKYWTCKHCGIIQHMDCCRLLKKKG